MTTTRPQTECISCININFDSLGWSAGRDPLSWRDPSFFEIADRFFKYSDRHNFKYTIFVIGRDLQNNEVRERVRQWALAGHEIANHSYHHHPNLGSRPDSEIEWEIRTTHDLITECCGVAPRGFVAPGWSASPKVQSVLRKLNYLYDTSIFASWMMFVVRMKLLWNFRHDARKNDFLHRKDTWANLFAPNQPYHASDGSLLRGTDKSLLVLPLAATRGLRIPCWHTAAFMYPPWLFNSCLDACLREPFFYYLVHPADLMDQEDFNRCGVAAANLERMADSLDTKDRLFDRYIERIVRGSQRMARLDEIASRILAEPAPG